MRRIATTAPQHRPPVAPERGRGATRNPANRFRRDERTPVDTETAEDDDTSPPSLATTVTIQRSRTIVARNDSPDIPFDRSINPYQGCEHGCVYCYARPTHAYLDLSPGLDFESRLFAKPDAPELLRAELAKPGYSCLPMALGTNTDPYQPIERTWRITRGVLEVLAECEHPFTIVTKGALVERDLDLIAPMAAKRMARVYLSVTTLDAELARRLEPRAASPRRRLRAMSTLAAAGVPVGVMVAPVIPQLNDRDLEAILAASADAGATESGYIMLRLPLEVQALFRDWMDAHYPLRTAHVMSLMRQLHGGRHYDATFGTRQRGRGAFAELFAQRFALAARRSGLDGKAPPLDTSRFAPPRTQAAQRELF